MFETRAEKDLQYRPCRLADRGYGHFCLMTESKDGSPDQGGASHGDGQDLSYARLAAHILSPVPSHPFKKDAGIPPLSETIRPLTGALFLLVLDALHILIRHPAHVHHPIEDVVTVVPLHHNLLAAARRLRDTAARRDCSTRQPPADPSFRL